MPSAPKFLLLVGTARSGTSWIGKIFDSHPQTLYKYEPDGAINLPLAIPLDETQRVAPGIRDFFAGLPAINTPSVAGTLPIFFKQYRSRLGQGLHHLSVRASTTARLVSWKLPVFQAANVYSSEVRVVWKSIASLGRIGTILGVIEDCRAVRILRHPCGYISSVLRGEAQHKFASAVPASEDYGLMEIILNAAGAFRRGLSVNHMRQFHPVERMAWLWVLLNEKAIGDTTGNERCMEVRYEDVCLRPDEKIKELFSFCNLTWNTQTADFLKTSTLTAPPHWLNRATEQRYYGVFRDPILAADKWKSEFGPENIERVYRILRQSDLLRVYPESELAVRNSSVPFTTHEVRT